MQFFIRVRGRVLGPFDEQKLRALASRGQFGKMHEVSEDGMTWSRASLYPDLFRGGDTAVVVAENSPVVETRQEQPADYYTTVQAAPATPAPPSGPGGWYYSANGQQQGPVGFANLQLMVQTGQLSSSSLVWTNGMSQWLPASQVDGLASTPPTTQSANEKLSAGVVTQLSESKPWLVFFAVLWTLATVSLLIGGVTQLIRAAKVSEVSKNLASILAGQSIACFIEGIIACVTTVMLFSLVGLIRDFVYYRTEVTLEASLRKARHLLVFWGVLSIISIVIVMVAVIYLLAVE